MRGIIILEGPDASGKSTLAKKLIELNHGGTILHATYRFANKIPVYHGALLRKAYRLSKHQLVIIDRLHISEYIYAKVFRGGTKWPWQLPVFNQICKELHIPIVLCTPFNIKQGLEWFNASKNERPEMYDDIEEIIKEYIEYANNNDCIIYNRNMTVEPFYYEYIWHEIKKELFKNE